MSFLTENMERCRKWLLMTRNIYMTIRPQSYGRVMSVGDSYCKVSDMGP